MNCLNDIDKWLSDLTKSKENVKILITGDFNMGFLGDWSPQIINKIYEDTNRRIDDDKSVSDDKIQAVKLIEMCEKRCLIQKVSESTRQERILDLVLTSEEELIDDIKHIRHEKLSDHDTMIINLSNINDVKETIKI